jgi:hypothetical protein
VLRSAELQISRLCSAKDGAAGAGGFVLSRAWTSSWTARRFRALQRTTDVSATTKHVRSALKMRDVDRTPHGWRLPTPLPHRGQYSVAVDRRSTVAICLVARHSLELGRARVKILSARPLARSRGACCSDRQ